MPQKVTFYLFLALAIHCVYSTPSDDLLKKKNSEYPTWIEANGRINDPKAITIGEFQNSKNPVICRLVTSDGLIPGTADPASGVCTAIWNNAVVTSSHFEYLSGPLGRLDWAESNRGNIPTGAVIGGITNDDRKIYIVRLAKDKNSVETYYGGGITKGDRSGSVFKEGKAFTTPTYEVLCLTTIII
ncbi:uncharacterized protein LOC107369159 [Tetranychus urticae]|uniref:Uncharacterized protein n=1 Tax=Tetranychus urticae TaxID=32264 RepID=T1L0I3_TETUR|nr:uncharacterized protein LOC107369159 [Tetranychus urticae]